LSKFLTRRNQQVAVRWLILHWRPTTSLFLVVPLCYVIRLLSGAVTLPHAQIQTLHVLGIDLTVEQRALRPPLPHFGSNSLQTTSKNGRNKKHLSNIRTEAARTSCDNCLIRKNIRTIPDRFPVYWQCPRTPAATRQSIPDIRVSSAAKRPLGKPTFPLRERQKATNCRQCH